MLMSPSLNRRTVLAAGAVCACCVLTGDIDAQDQSGSIVDVGPVTDFEKDGVYDKLARSAKVLIIRKGKRLIAANSICSHKACVVKVVDDGLKCPCHGSLFEADGTIVKGPAKSSLLRYGIRIEAGRILVDKSKSFDEKNWVDVAASVEVE